MSADYDWGENSLLNWRRKRLQCICGGVAGVDDRLGDWASGGGRLGYTGERKRAVERPGDRLQRPIYKSCRCNYNTFR